jgi:hypothetical protein
LSAEAETEAGMAETSAKFREKGGEIHSPAAPAKAAGVTQVTASCPPPV